LSNSYQGFKDDASGTLASDTIDDYQYDLNGNMTQDQNKNITSIVYNHLNLPTKINFGTGSNIVYTYDATGVKLKKVVTVSPTVTTTEYLNGFQYTDNVLEFFPTAEGYVKHTLVSSTSKFNYVYNHTDHLGNVRLSYTKDPTTGTLKIMEENHNYPFGLKHNYNNTDYEFTVRGSNIVLTQICENKYNYQYNGKEWQDEMGLNWYDYGWRNYDAAINRWVVPDPLLNDLDFAYDDSQVDSENDDEIYLALITKLETGGGIFNPNNLNPYSYGYNDPVSFDDPDGRCPWCIAIFFIMSSTTVIAPTGQQSDIPKIVESNKSNNNYLISAVTPAGGGGTSASAVLSAKAKNEAQKQVAKVTGKEIEKTYQTYTKDPKNPATDGVYSGKTSGTNTPQKNVANRDKNHHMNETHKQAKLDKSSKSEGAIRGREQQLIDKNGGAKKQGGTSGNTNRGISITNKNSKIYNELAKKEFGKIW